MQVVIKIPRSSTLNCGWCLSEQHRQSAGATTLTLRDFPENSSRQADGMEVSMAAVVVLNLVTELWPRSPTCCVSNERTLAISWLSTFAAQLRAAGVEWQ